MHSHRMHAPCQAHESAVWSLAWHPLGHLLASGSNDHAIKFWCRSRPGDGKKRAREDEDKEEEARAAATLQPDAATRRCNPMPDGLQRHTPRPIAGTRVHVARMPKPMPKRMLMPMSTPMSTPTCTCCRWTRRPSAC